MQNSDIATNVTLGNPHFLSKTNPTATADQRDLEARAIKLLSMPAIVKAKAIAEHQFRLIAGSNVPEEAWQGFDQLMVEYTYHYVLLALNSDSNYPKVLGHGYGPPHEWFGMQVPGCRGPGTGENADNNYSFIPVDGYAHFELYGRRFDPPVGDCPFYITANTAQTVNVSMLDWRDLKFNADGSFKIEVGPEPAEGRANYLQASPDARYLFIRDGRIDWRQVPNGYLVRRQEPPTRQPLSDQEVAEMAARFMVNDVPMSSFLRQMMSCLEPNTVSEVAVSSGFGGIPSQKFVRGRIRIEKDEAFVFHLGAGGAKYWFLPSYDWWGMSGDFWNRTSCLNNAQSQPNADGSYTYVFSNADPGVHNWIDTLGRRESLFWNRWHLLPQESNGPGGEPWAKGEMVKLKYLDRALPAGTKRMSSEERRQQLEERLAAFMLRYVDR